MIIYTFSTHFLLQPSQKLAPKYIFVKIIQIFLLIDPSNANNFRLSTKKGPSNSIQASIMLIKMCWCLVWLHHIKVKKSYRDRIFEFWFFLRFCLLFNLKMARFKKNKLFEISKAKISKMKQNIKILAFTRFSYYWSE